MRISPPPDFAGPKGTPMNEFEENPRGNVFSRRAALGGLVGAVVAPNLIAPRPAAAAVVRGGIALLSPTAIPRVGHTSTVLLSGQILVAGGYYQGEMADVQIYDLGKNTWFSAAPMRTPRANHAAALLPQGQVLVMGGGSETTGPIADAEVYDPESDFWSPAPPMLVSRYAHSAAVVREGVIVLGGFNGGPLASAELYDGSTWSLL